MSTPKAFSELWVSNNFYMRHLCMEVLGWQRWYIFRPLLQTANHLCCCSWTTWHTIQNELDHSTFFSFNTVTKHQISSSNQMLNPYQFTIIIRVIIIWYWVISGIWTTCSTHLIFWKEARTQQTDTMTWSLPWWSYSPSVTVKWYCKVWA